MSHSAKIRKAYIRWQYENFNWKEVDEIHPEDIQAAADLYDQLLGLRYIQKKYPQY